MKVRIKGNTLRLRLSRTEVENFGLQGYLEESTAFGENKLIYSLRRSDREKLEADFDNNKITVYVPAKTTIQWVNTDMVGFNNHTSVLNPTELAILVEKDFKCMDAAVDEDQSDNYENPNQVC